MMFKTALVTAILAAAVSASHNHRHAHDVFKLAKKSEAAMCVPTCTTYYTTITGSGALYTPPAPATTVATSVAAVTEAQAPVSTLNGPVTVPTPIAQTCPTPGVYSFTAATVVMTETTTVVAASTTTVSSGTHTLGGVTTVVTTSTTVVLPYATTSTHSNGVVTSILLTTSYVCPSAGTYTIAPHTATVTVSETVLAVPVVTTVIPGSYVASATVVTVTETDTVVYCPFTSITPVPAAVVATSAAPVPAADSSAAAPVVPASSAAAPVVPVAASSAAVPIVPVPASSAVVVPVPASSAIVVPAPASSAIVVPAPDSGAVAPASAAASAVVPAASAAAASPGLGSSGSSKQWAITYTPFNNDGSCKSQSQVSADIASIRQTGFSAVRVYSTDCSTLDFVGPACRANGLKMIVGIFIGQPGCDNSHPDVAEQVSALVQWRQWDLVQLAVIGNEAAFNGFCSMSQLRNLITTVKSQLQAAGYPGPVTTTEVLSVWLDNPRDQVASICDVIDVVAINAHAYFNTATLPALAGPFVAGQLEIAKRVCGKPAYVMETGWPSQGICENLACAGPSQQVQAIESIKNTCGGSVVFFSFSNDGWKQAGACQCEQWWGLNHLFGNF